MPGYKMYLNSIQAKIALNNFNVYEQKLNLLLEIKEKYNKAFNIFNTSNHLYRINILKNRNEFIEYMKGKNIACGIHYEAQHLNPVYNIEPISLPLSDSNSNTTVSIPYHEQLTDKEVEYIIKTINSFNDKIF
jgi:dTDP-4-amino-4,6-dideoxygalactose transaminase